MFCCLHSPFGLSIASRLVRAARDMRKLVHQRKLTELYCGPLSLTTVSGIPCRANTDFSAAITLRDVVDFSWITSG